MPKLKVPLLSLDARGSLAKLFAFAKRRGQHIVENMPTPTDAKSPNQLFYRHMFTKCADLWHTLSEAEQQAWESSARPLHMTGYAYWMSSCLRPNPGIYLPLQGGTMSGAIEMDDNHIHGLPEPIHVQDPLRRQDYIDYIQPYLYNQGARAYHDAHQSIPDATDTKVALNSELYDTDTIHDNVTFNSRLTCKTAGVYVILGLGFFEANATGIRRCRLILNNATYIAATVEHKREDNYGGFYPTSIWDMNVNDYVELLVYQNSGAPLNLLTSSRHSPELMMWRIGA